MPSTVFTTPDKFDVALHALFKEAMEAQAGAVERAMYRAAQMGKAEVIRQIDAVEPFPPVNTGQMKGGYDVVRIPGGATLENPLPQAVYMEFGTRPHFPPIAAMRAWAAMKLRGSGSLPSGFQGPKRRFGRGEKADMVERLARGAQAKIGREGTAPRRFHAKAAEKFPEFVAAALRHELAAIAARSFAKAVR